MSDLRDQILILDNDEASGELLLYLLREAGGEVVLTRTAPELWERLSNARREGTSFRFLVASASALLVPGHLFVSLIKREFPGLSILAVASGASLPLRRRLGASHVELLEKPFSVETLIDRVSGSFESRRHSHPRDSKRENKG